MSRRSQALVAVVALTFGLAACADGGDGPVSEPPPAIDVSDGGGDGGGDAAPSDGGGDESDESGEPEPTADAPDIPAPDPADYPGMDENTSEGAEQAFRHYIAVAMWARQTGHGSELKTLQAPDCESCLEFNETVATLQEEGEYWEPFSINDVDLQVHESDNFDHEIAYLFATSAHSRPSLEGGERQDIPRMEYVLIGGMDWSGDSWVVGGIQGEWSDDAHS